VTQPVAPVVRYEPKPSGGRRRRGFCLSPFVLAVFIMVLSCGCLGLGGIWASQVARPRTNVLILGLDRRPEQGNVVRSDVLMLLTAYPQGPQLGLLSIPRDLYVDIPAHGQSRINTAHFWGERERPGGGPALAMETVAANFGVPVHRYVRVDFDAFRAVVDAVGGIEVVVEERIVDNAYPTEDYGTMRIEIPAGRQRMDGERALRYVRSRHGASDFERAERQQKVMIALAQRLAAPMSWPRLPAVFWAVAEHVETNLGPVDLVQLSLAALRVGPDGIEHHVIDRDMTRPWTTPTGGAVLLPRWDAINPLVESVFAP
jgi:LCP family protein required for cell wall assembly